MYRKRGAIKCLINAYRKLETVGLKLRTVQPLSVNHEVHDQIEGEQVRSYEAKLSPVLSRLRPPQPNGRKSEKDVWEKN